MEVNCFGQVLLNYLKLEELPCEYLQINDNQQLIANFTAGSKL